MTDVVVTGIGCSSAGCDPRPYLRVRKMRKYMGEQDALAVVAGGLALEDAGLERPLGDALGERTGLYLAVGYLPFVQKDIDRLMEDSTEEDGRFTMRAFTTGGYDSVNPLLTFRCLSNMPAFHVSASFNVQGPYLTSYPGPGLLYQCLDEASAALRAGEIELALVGGVAHQANFLVRHHFSRVDPPIEADRLGDAAGVLVLETAAHAVARGARPKLRLSELALSYTATHPFEERREPSEAFAGLEAQLELELGTASLPVALGRFAGEAGDALVHTLETRDGYHGRSAWERAS